MNRLANSSNRYQGKYRRVLCVCSAGLLRSPTAAWVLSNPPFNFNTRAAGLDSEFALIPVDDVLLRWADEIVCMTKSQEDELKRLVPEKDVTNLDIPDEFEYRDEELVRLVREKYGKMVSLGLR